MVLQTISIKANSFSYLLKKNQYYFIHKFVYNDHGENSEEPRNCNLHCTSLLKEGFVKHCFYWIIVVFADLWTTIQVANSQLEETPLLSHPTVIQMLYPRKAIYHIISVEDYWVETWSVDMRWNSWIVENAEELKIGKSICYHSKKFRIILDVAIVGPECR